MSLLTDYSVAKGEADAAVADRTQQQPTANGTESGGTQSVSDARATDAAFGTAVLVTGIVAAVPVAVSLQRRAR